MKLRVLHVNGELTWRGGERQVDLLVRYSNHAIQNIVACPARSELSKRLQEKGHAVIDWSHKNGLDFAAAWNLKAICQEEGIDIVHCHTPKALSIGVISKILGNKRPIICTKRTSFPIGNHLFSRYKYKKAEQVVTVSEASAKQLSSQIHDLPIKVIPSAIEKISSVQSGIIERTYPSTKGKKKIGFAAALTAEKNLDCFLETAKLAIASHPDYCFLWIGEGELKSTLEHQIHSSGLQEQVILAGFQKDIHSWLHDLDVLFFPSSAEGYPTTLLDAMQHQTPVVASEIPGIQEIISKKNGVLCPVKDSHAFFMAIEKVLLNDRFNSDMISNATKSLVGHFAEDMAAAYLKIYRDISG